MFHHLEVLLQFAGASLGTSWTPNQKLDLQFLACHLFSPRVVMLIVPFIGCQKQSAIGLSQNVWTNVY